eukprot:1147238-Pelagomonas_calceolata.AAC.4
MHPRRTSDLSAAPHLSLLLDFDALQELAAWDATVHLTRLKDGQLAVQQEKGNDEPGVTQEQQRRHGFGARKRTACHPARRGAKVQCRAHEIMNLGAHRGGGGGGSSAIG